MKPSTSQVNKKIWKGSLVDISGDVIWVCRHQHCDEQLAMKCAKRAIENNEYKLYCYNIICKR